jgi:hypothetical protein
MTVIEAAMVLDDDGKPSRVDERMSKGVATGEWAEGPVVISPLGWFAVHTRHFQTENPTVRKFCEEATTIMQTGRVLGMRCDDESVLVRAPSGLFEIRAAEEKEEIAR